MNNVIYLSEKKQDAYSTVEKMIRDTLGEAGFREGDINQVVAEHKKIYEELNVEYKAEMQLPGDIVWHEAQLSAIEKAHNDCVNDIFKHFSELIAYANHIIIGLLAREKLNKQS